MIVVYYKYALKCLKDNINISLLWTDYNFILFTGSHEKMDYAVILKALHG